MKNSMLNGNFSIVRVKEKQLRIERARHVFNLQGAHFLEIHTD